MRTWTHHRTQGGVVVASVATALAAIGLGDAVGTASAEQATAAHLTSRSPAPDWSATWIGRPTAAQRAAHGTQEPSPLLRREFTIPAKIRKARLKIVGLGFYEAYINGKRVGDGVLDPPPSQYDRTAFSRTFDVTPLVRSGENAIGVELGRSYFSSPAPPNGFDLGDTLFGLSKAQWWEEPRLLAQLEITTRDGNKQIIGSDDSWSMADGPRRDALFYGEIYDARAAIADWTLPSFDDSAWEVAPEQDAPTAKIVPAKMPPVKVMRTIEPVGVTQVEPNISVYDFGRAMGGWARITLTGVAGTSVTLRYGEQLDPSGRVIKPVLGEHTDVYTLSGAPRETWEPSFTRHGFRYVQVETPPAVSNVKVQARLAHTALRTPGHFRTSNPLLNRIHRNQLNTLRDNLYGIPTDTPWRDRQGWTADAYLFFRGAALNFDVDAFYDRWLMSFRDAQKQDGGLPPIVPNSGATMLDSYSSDPSWGGTFTLDVWEHYLQYGRQAMLRDNYRAVGKYLELLRRTVSATGYIFEGTSFGDWASPGSENNVPPGNINAPEGPMLTATGDLYREFRTAAMIARRLAKPGDADRFAKTATRISEAFNKRFLDKATNTYRTDVEDAGYRQTSNVLPLAYGLVPEKREKRVLNNLIADIKARGTDLDTGSIGTKLLLPTLTQFGHGQLAYRLATQTDYPSWGYWVKQGSGTSWETWEVNSPVLSMNHPFLGTVEDWFYNHLAGIRASKPGYDAIRIQPIYPRGLNHAQATVGTPHGKVSSSWRRRDGAVTLTVRVPAGIPAVIRVPTANGRDEVHRVRGGVHTFRS